MPQTIIFWVSDHNTPAVQLLNIKPPEPRDRLILLVSPRYKKPAELLADLLRVKYPSCIVCRSDEDAKLKLSGHGDGDDAEALKHLTGTILSDSFCRFIATGGTKMANLVLRKALDQHALEIEYIPEYSDIILHWKEQESPVKNVQKPENLHLHEHFALYGEGRARSGFLLQKESLVQRILLLLEPWQSVLPHYIEVYRDERSKHKKAGQIPQSFFEGLPWQGTDHQLYCDIVELVRIIHIPLTSDYKPEVFPFEGFWLEYLWAARLYARFKVPIGLANDLAESKNDLDLAWLNKGQLQVGEVKSGYKSKPSADITEWCYKLEAVASKVGRCQKGLYLQEKLRPENIEIWANCRLRLASSQVAVYFQPEDLDSHRISPWHWDSYFIEKGNTLQVDGQIYRLRAVLKRSDKNGELLVVHFDGGQQQLFGVTSQHVPTASDNLSDAQGLQECAEKFGWDLTTLKLFKVEGETGELRLENPEMRVCWKAWK